MGGGGAVYQSSVGGWSRSQVTADTVRHLDLGFRNNSSRCWSFRQSTERNGVTDHQRWVWFHCSVCRTFMFSSKTQQEEKTPSEWLSSFLSGSSKHRANHVLTLVSVIFNHIFDWNNQPWLNISVFLQSADDGKGKTAGEDDVIVLVWGVIL